MKSNREQKETRTGSSVYYRDGYAGRVEGLPESKVGHKQEGVAAHLHMHPS